jgi:hypothetical protein
MAFLRPTADVSDGGWTTDTGGVSLFAALDEVTQSDTDYVRSSENPVNDAMEVNLGPPTGVLTSGTLRFALGKLLSNAVEVDIKIELRQGGATLITWEYPNVAAGFTLEGNVLTAGQRAAIAPGVDVHIRVTANPTTDFLLRDRADTQILQRDGLQIHARES